MFLYSFVLHYNSCLHLKKMRFALKTIDSIIIAN